jgi:hypothetical protein
MVLKLNYCSLDHYCSRTQPVSRFGRMHEYEWGSVLLQVSLRIKVCPSRGGLIMNQNV